MRVFATLFCDPVLKPALLWLDACRGVSRQPEPAVPVPWSPDWVRSLQTGPSHVFFDDHGLEIVGDKFRDGDVKTLVCSLLPFVDHMSLGHFGGRRPRLGHGGILTFPDGEVWRASPAQELRLACMFENTQRKGERQ
jgi:hypothetical protein